MLSLDQVSNSLNALWRVVQSLSQRVVVWELLYILRDDEMKPGIRRLNVPDLQDLQVVTHDISGEGERRDIDDFHVGIAKSENTGDLSILPLQELLHGHSLELIDREGVDVDFHSFLALDLRPSSAEFFLHLSPDEKRLIVELFNFGLGGLDHHVQSELILNHHGFSPQEFQLDVRALSLEPSPISLNANGCQLGAVWTSEHPRWNLYVLTHIFLIDQAIKKLLDC